ncbi:MAG: GH92 family glycosyl hydrolase [Muribaculaceae bacterium]|nr:GH92 family glycosyl hydrolase [Muribaculaceae bacterium]
MQKELSLKLIIAAFIFFGTASIAFAKDKNKESADDNFNPASFVNPFVGSSNYGATNPGPVTPNGMMSVAPFNVMGSETNKFDKDKSWWSTPYAFENNFLTGFSHVNLSGVGCPDLGSILTMATTGDIDPDYHNYGSPYSDEFAEPGYYRNHLSKYDITSEVTVTTRSSVERYTFPDGDGNIIVNLGQGLTNESGATIKKVNDTEIEGVKLMGTFCYQPQAVFPIYFVIKVSRKPDSQGYWKKQPVVEGPKQAWDPDNGNYKFYTKYSKELSGDNIGYWWSFDNLKKGEQIEVRTGVSFVSIENARENLEKEQEGLAFDEIREQALKSWNDHLSRIKVKGGSKLDKELFYTALYHALIHPNILNDINGQYPLMETDGFGVADHNRYTVFSLWDTMRNLHQLLTLVYPEKQTDMLKTLAGMAQESGWLPKWELYGKETYTMEGDPAIPVIVDSYRKGLTDFNVDATYAAMKKSATAPGLSNLMRPDIDPYIEKGFIPVGYYAADMSGDNSVSHALEYYVADNALSWLADYMNEPDFANVLRQRSRNWKHYYNPQTKTLAPLDSTGKVIDNFNPDQGANFENAPGFHEGSAWNYTFYVPHDIESMIDIIGGPQNFVDQLQYIFDNGLYDPTNEPDFAYPYLFSRIPGEEWRTQKTVNELIKKNFFNSPGGLPGNEDTGTMSAWLIFSMMGLYPDTPGEPYYTLTTPVFDEITINPGTPDEILIKSTRKNPKDIFIKNIILGDKTLDTYRITHDDLIHGKELKFNLKNHEK